MFDISEDLQQAGKSVFPGAGSRVAAFLSQLPAGMDVEVIQPAIKSTHKIFVALKDLLAKGYVLSFDETNFETDIPDKEVLKNPAMAAMYVADGFIVIAAKDDDVLTFGRTKQRMENDAWGFTSCKLTKQ